MIRDSLSKATRAMNGELVSVQSIEEAKEIVKIVFTLLGISKKPEELLAEISPDANINNGFYKGDFKICGLACKVSSDNHNIVSNCELAFVLKKPNYDPFTLLYSENGVLAYVTTSKEPGTVERIYFSKKETAYWG